MELFENVYYTSEKDFRIDYFKTKEIEVNYIAH